MNAKHKFGIFIVSIGLLGLALFTDWDKGKDTGTTTTTVSTVPTTTLVRTTESGPVTYNTITATFEGGGTVIPPAGKITVAEGQDQKFRFVPDECYEITEMRVDGVSVDVTHSHTFGNVSEDHVIHAVFTLKKECHATTESQPANYRISATSQGDGSVIPSGDVLLLKGHAQKFTFEPAKCHAVANVIINGVSVGAIQNFTFENIQAASSIHAVFTPITDCDAD